MLASAFMMLVGSAFLMLRMGNSTGSFPKPLTAAEEKKYLELWQQGDEEARNVLIEHNLRLVAHIVKKYYTPNADVDDLISIGTIGLIKGVSSYKPDRGVRLATYASRCIENEVLMYFRSARKSAQDVSLSETIDNDGNGSELCLMDVVTFEDDILEQISRSELSKTLRTLVDEVLDPRESEIISLRYGLGGQEPLTQHEVAAQCGISRSYVSHRACCKKRRDEQNHPICYIINVMRFFVRIAAHKFRSEMSVKWRISLYGMPKASENTARHENRTCKTKIFLVILHLWA